MRRTAEDREPAVELEIAAPDAGAFVAAAQQWMHWRDAHAAGGSPADDAWRPDRLEYELSVTARCEGLAPVELGCDAWHGELLDWYHFDSAIAEVGPDAAAELSAARRRLVSVLERRRVALGGPLDPLPAASAPVAPVDPATMRVTLSCTPSHLGYPGMPVPRYWQLEDARVNFAKVDCAESDLARLLLLGFVNAYGNDWYLVPLTLPVGCLHVVRSFVVKDTFDDEAIVDAFGEEAKAGAGGSPSSAFSLFRSTVRGSGGQRRLKGLLLISGVEPLSSEPLEVVRFFRDEAANLAWAIEATTTGVDGRPLHHASAIVHAGDSSGSGPGAPDGPLQYRLMSDVPAHWHPLVADEAQRFTLGDERAPKGRALRPGMRLRQEEIPADGVDLFRRSQLVRSADGRTIVWVGRRKRVGQGGGASGL